MYSDCNAFAFVHLKLWLIDWLIDWKTEIVVNACNDRIANSAVPRRWYGASYCSWFTPLEQSATSCHFRTISTAFLKKRLNLFCSAAVSRPNLLFPIIDVTLFSALQPSGRTPYSLTNQLTNNQAAQCMCPWELGRQASDITEAFRETTHLFQQQWGGFGKGNAQGGLFLEYFYCPCASCCNQLELTSCACHGKRLTVCFQI